MSPSSPLSSIPDGENSTLSSPLSTLSKTPSAPSSPTMLDPTKRYPSPSTTASGPHSPAKMSDLPSEDEIVAKPLDASTQGPPPAKKRRIAPPKERTTEYLDLMKSDEEQTEEDTRQLNRLLDTLRKKKKIVVIAGAGISVAAGIPDFRSSTGLFASVKNQHNLKGSGKHLFDASVYKHDDTTESFHAMVREMAAKTKSAQPTQFHHLLASLAKEGRLLRLYSQNIDCIDTSMEPLATQVPLNPKGPWPTTIQLHGGLQKMVCTKCSSLQEFDGEIFTGPKPPLCPTCKDLDEVRTAHAGKRSHGIGRLRPRFVLYNEYNPDEEAIGNVSSADLKARPDAVVVVGTTLKVPGTRRLVREMCQVTRGRKNGVAIWINLDDEPKGVDLKNCWDIVVRSKCDNVARLTNLPHWDFDIGEGYELTKEEERDLEDRLARGKTTLEVNIPASSPSLDPEVDEKAIAKPKQVEQAQGIPTPNASPKITAAKKPGKKQSTLSFNGQEPTTAATSAPKSRKRGRKPAQPKPNTTAVGHFKTVKNVTNQDKAKKPASRVPAKRKATVSDLTHKSSYENPQTPNSNPDNTSAGPPSPVTTNKVDTISPKIYPRGMQGLID
jgi:NAD-dependent histone deacetylase SIR2